MDTRDLKIAVVTGATSGLGEAAAVALAGRKVAVVLVGRDEGRGKALADRVRGAGGKAEFVRADLLSQKDVRRLSAELRGTYPRIDILVNNAGGTFGKRELTSEGVERTFALNVVAPYLLTRELGTAVARARIVNVATGVPGSAKLDPAELVEGKNFSALGSYTRAKLAVQMLTREQARLLPEATPVVIHPGIIPGTRFGAEMPKIMVQIGAVVARLFGLSSTLGQAAGRYVEAALADVERGAFYAQGKLGKYPRQADNEAARAVLLHTLDALVKRTE